MKKFLFYAVCIVIGLSSCKETPPPINFTDTVAQDTTYVLATVPTADPHNVLFEDFTGPKCSNCPSAKKTSLDPLIAANPGRVNVISLHVTDFSQANPVAGSRFDLRDSVATLIEQSIYQSLFGMPIAGIDRMPYGNATQGSVYQILPPSWASTLQAQLAVKDSLNLDVSATYNSVAGTASIEVKVTYLYATSNIQHLSVAIVEDSIIDLQDDALFVDSAYQFDDVLRGLVTSAPYGDPILSAKLLPTYPAKEAGRVYIRRYTYPMKSKWNVNHCKVTAFVHKDIAGGGVRVMQSKQVAITK